MPPDKQGCTHLWRGALIRFLSVAYGVFLTGFFVFPEAHQRIQFYYCFVLAPFLPFVRETVQHMQLRRGPILAVLFIAYMAITTIWSDGNGWSCTGRTVAQGLLTVSFLLIPIMLVYETRGRFHLLLQAVCAGAAVFGLISVLLWYAANPFPGSRLVSFSKLNNPVLVGLAYGPVALLTAAYGFSSQSIARRILFLVIFIVLCMVILLTQSRNVLIATLAGLVVLIWYWRRSPLAPVILTGLLLLGAVCGNWIYARFDQGIGYRTEIWHSAVAQIFEAPLAGHGYCSDNSVTVGDETFVHVHSGYLTAARDGGVIGLVLLILLVVQSIRDASVKMRFDGDPAALALMVYAATCLVPDTDRLLTLPKEDWLYFWLPIALASAPAPGKH